MKIVVPTSSSSFPVPVGMTRLKKTARKTMSSFTPKIIRPEAEIITLSDEEEESSVAKCSNDGSGVAKCSNGGSGVAKQQVVVKVESEPKKPVQTIKNEPKTEPKGEFLKEIGCCFKKKYSWHSVIGPSSIRKIQLPDFLSVIHITPCGYWTKSPVTEWSNGS